MTTILVLLSVTCFFVRTNSVENIYPDNGWRPTSNEKVLELRRNFIKTPNVQFQALRFLPGHALGTFEKENFVKILQSKEINIEQKMVEDHQTFLSKDPQDETAYTTELIKIIQPPLPSMIPFETGTLNCEVQNHNESEQKLRKPKMIDDSKDVTVGEVRNNIDNNEKVQNNNLSDGMNETTKMSHKSVSNKTYEVKENPEENDLLASDQNLFYANKHTNEERKIKTSDIKNNFTANLLNILANYNIRTGDKLPNYAISLRQNSRNADNHDYVYVPIKVPLKFNSANHMPLDPLLAVFLSNYGHYLPGLYGYQRGYNNLYGYLASNNIHNNKPFGSYKIFSDTDSSN